MATNYEARVLSALLKRQDMVSVMGEPLDLLMKTHGDVWEFIERYYHRNRELPPVGIVLEEFPDFEYDENESEDGVVITKSLYTPFNFWAYHNPSMVEGEDEIDEIVSEENKLLEQIIEKGENRNLEFKSTFRYCLQKKSAQPYIEFEIIKTIAAFANTNGGTLIVGVDDNGQVLGLENDFSIYKHSPKDKFLKHFANILGSGFTEPIDAIINYGFESTLNEEVFLVIVEKSKKIDELLNRS